MKSSKDVINRIYKNNDIQRWRTMDFVLGYKINLSNNPNKECEICSFLCGIYPKNFNWSGWCDKCKCFLTPILQDPDDFDAQELEEMKAAWKGIKFEPKEPEGLIKILPKNFLTWYAQNVQEMLDTNVFPDFVRDNIELIKESFEYYRNNQ